MHRVDITNHLSILPLVAILRGLRPENALDVGAALLDAGIRVIEVPLNSPEPFDSIAQLVSEFGSRCAIGAGTVLSIGDVEALASVGGSLVVSPNTNPAVIQRSIELGMVPMPGVATATEALMAYQAGARYLKLFPASTYGAQHVRALAAVLPDDAKILAVGGVGSHNAGEWFSAGVVGIGAGTELFTLGDSAQLVSEKAAMLVESIHQMRKE